MATDSTLLLVENDTAVLRILERAVHLANPGVQVIESRTVAVALHVLAHESVRGIISEYQLSDGTVLELLAASQKLTPRPKVLVLSATPSVSLLALGVGADEFLAKPFSLASLLSVIGRML